jgi:predicted DCC family thiol-disulfide oxidoreductase YuxK
MEPPARHLLLYDGDCGLCDRSVRFVAERDPGGLFAFAPLASDRARAVLARHDVPPDEPARTFFVAADAETRRERLLSRSDAAVFVGRTLGAGVGLGARVLRVLPRRLRDAAYDFVARHRHRFFPRPASCAVAPAPPPEPPVEAP